MQDKENKDFLTKTQEDQRILDVGLKMSRAHKKERLEDEVKRLRAEVGNLEVQNSEYAQIVAELSEKLQRYEKKYGSVFTRAAD
jgi:uncharacterized coiled-coil DUF342 family protein